MKKIQITIFTLFIFVSAAMAQNNLNYQWHKTNKEFIPNKTIIDKQGNFYMYGVFEDSLDADFGPGKTMIYANLKSRHQVYRSAYIVKYNNEGNFVWANTVKGNHIYRASDIYFNADETSVFILGNYFDSLYGDGAIEPRNSAGGFDAFFCRYSAQTGALERVSSLGGAGYEEGSKGLFDKDGNHYILYYQEVYTPQSFRYGILIKVNPAGSVVYNYNFGMQGSGGILLKPYELALDSNNNAYIMGQFDRAFTFKNLQGNNESMFPELSGSQSIFIFKVGGNGATTGWIKYGLYNKNVWNPKMAVTKNGEVYLTYYHNLDGYGVPGENLNNAYLIKYNSQFAYQWSTRIESIDDYNYNTSITTDGSNNVYLAGLNQSDFTIVSNTDNVGNLQDTVRTGKTYSQEYLAGNGSNYLIKMNSAGAITWCKQYKNGNGSYIYQMILNNSNDLFLLGLAKTKLHPVANSDANSEDLTTDAFFIVKNTQTWPTNIQESKTPHNTINIFPNPCQNTLYFDTNDKIEKIELFDLRGQRIMVQANQASNLYTLEIPQLVNGVYITKVYTNKGVEIQKILVQH
jgi:hypothetical protein